MRRRSGHSRRGLALLAVLLLVVVGALVAAGVLVTAAGARTETDAANRLTRSRLAAVSGLRAALAEFDDQRDAILSGANPDLTEAWTLESSSTGRQTVVRLAPFEPDGPAVISEATRVDLHRAPASVLASWTGRSESEAESLRAQLDASPPGAPEDVLDRLGLPEGASKPTVFLVEPDLISGLAPETADRRGAARLLPSDTCETDAEIAVLNGLERSPDATALAWRLVDLDLSPLNWGAIYDAVSITNGEARLGLIDLNRASARTLALLPGLNEDLADQIVHTRERLDDDTLRSIAWPVTEGVLEVDRFAEAAPWLTTSSWQWRVRIEAGSLPPEDLSDYEGIGGVSDEARLSGAISAAALEFPVVLEAVIDLSVSPPRLAYLAERTPNVEAHRATPLGTDQLDIQAFDDEAETVPEIASDPPIETPAAAPDDAEPVAPTPTARWRGVSRPAPDR